MNGNYVRRRIFRASPVSIITSALIVIFVLWITYRLVENNQIRFAKYTPKSPTTVTLSTVEVDKFIGFVEGKEAGMAMEIRHHYTSDGIHYLAAAIGSLGKQSRQPGLNIETRCRLLEQYGDKIQENTRSTSHADLTREAFITATDLFADIVNKADPVQMDHLIRLREAAQMIDPDQLLLRQKTRVEKFFRQSSAALQSMARARNEDLSLFHPRRL